MIQSPNGRRRASNVDVCVSSVENPPEVKFGSQTAVGQEQILRESMIRTGEKICNLKTAVKPTETPRDEDTLPNQFTELEISSDDVDDQVSFYDEKMTAMNKESKMKELREKN